LPLWIGLFALGGGLGASGVVLSASPAAWLGTLAAAAGGIGLVAQLRTGPLKHVVAGAAHLVVHPRARRFEEPDTGLQPLDLTASRLGVGGIGDFAWNRLAGFDACVQCGRCEDACPAFAAGQPLNPKALIQDLVAHLSTGGEAYSGRPHPGLAGRTAADPFAIVGPDKRIAPETLWACTTCRACVEACPMMIEHVDAIVALRRHETLEKGAAPAKAVAALSALRYADESGGRPLEARLDFAAGSELRVLGPGEEADLLLWLGDGTYDLRYGRTLRALVALLRRAGVDFAVLGSEERDCGDLARRLGDEEGFQRLAHANIAALANRRFRRVVTADPHALHVLRNEYPAFGGMFEVMHHTALLEELAAEGRLDVRPLALSATFHDPCYLGRYNGEIEAPRNLLRRIVSEPVEMALHGRRSFCCGGGGGAPVSDVPGEHRIPDLRMQQASATGAAVVAVACPGCTAMLEGVVGARPEVKDLAELMLEALQ
jgi:Fe-S oxidoreductase